MEKNIKKIIQVSCLVSLLVTCNQIIGMDKKSGGLFRRKHKKTTTREGKKTSSSRPQAFIPHIDFDVMEPLEEASTKLDDLINRGEKIGNDFRNEVQKTLNSYLSQSSIKIKDENDEKLIGVYNLEGWKKNKNIEGKIRIKIRSIQKQLNRLTNSN